MRSPVSSGNSFITENVTKISLEIFSVNIYCIIIDLILDIMNIYVSESVEICSQWPES